MGIYSLLVLTIGVFIIGAIYSQIKIKTLKINLVFFALLILYIIGYFLIHHQIEQTCDILISDNIAEVLTIIRAWGIAAPIISIILMVLQAVIAPLPAYLITAANGIIFGVVWGVIISSIGALAGALVSFSITRWFYKNVAINSLKNSTTKNTIEKISSKHGFKIILIARLIPIVSFDFISYAAGASTIKISHFLVATLIGMLPATIAYTVIAYKIGGIEKLSGQFVIYSTIAAFVLIGFWIVMNFWSKKNKKNSS